MFNLRRPEAATSLKAVSANEVEISADQRRHHLKDHDLIYASGPLAVCAVFDGAGKRDGAEEAVRYFDRRLSKGNQSAATVSAEQLRDGAHQAIKRNCDKSPRSAYPKTTAAIGRFVRMAANPGSFGLDFTVAGDSPIHASTRQSGLELVDVDEAASLPNGQSDYSNFLGSRRAVFKPGGVFELGEDDWLVTLTSDAVTDEARGGLSIPELSEIVLNSPIHEAASNVLAALTQSPDDASVIVVGPAHPLYVPANWA